MSYIKISTKERVFLKKRLLAAVFHNTSVGKQSFKNLFIGVEEKQTRFTTTEQKYGIFTKTLVATSNKKEYNPTQTLKELFINFGEKNYLDRFVNACYSGLFEGKTREECWAELEDESLVEETNFEDRWKDVCTYFNGGIDKNTDLNQLVENNTVAKQPQQPPFSNNQNAEYMPDPKIVEIEELKSQLAEKEVYLERLKSEFDEKLETANADVAMKEAELKKLRIEFDEKLEAANADLAKKGEELEMLKNEYERKLEAANADLAKKEEELKNIKSEYVVKLEAAKADLAKKEEDLNKLKSEYREKLEVAKVRLEEQEVNLKNSFENLIKSKNRNKLLVFITSVLGLLLLGVLAMRGISKEEPDIIPTTQINLACTWPRNSQISKHIKEFAENFEKEVNGTGRYTIQMNVLYEHQTPSTLGDITQKDAKGLLKQLQKGDIQMLHTSPYFMGSKTKKKYIYLYTTMVFGKTEIEMDAWLNQPDNDYTHMLTKIDREYDSILCFRAGNSGEQGGGWFKYKNLDKLKGTNIRFAGPAGEVLINVFGASINETWPYYEIYRKVIDGNYGGYEWLGYNEDVKVNLDIPNYYYCETPWNEISSEFYMIVDTQKGLFKDTAIVNILQATLESAFYNKENLAEQMGKEQKHKIDSLNFKLKGNDLENLKKSAAKLIDTWIDEDTAVFGKLYNDYKIDCDSCETLQRYLKDRKY